MKVQISYTEKDIKRLILQDLQKVMPEKAFKETDIDFRVKSTQNYRNDNWEIGQFKAELNVDRG